MTNKTFTLFCTIINALIMTAIISYTLTIVNVGLQNFNFPIWLRSWFIAFLLVFALSFYLPKWIRLLISKVIVIKEG